MPTAEQLGRELWDSAVKEAGRRENTLRRQVRVLYGRCTDTGGTGAYAFFTLADGRAIAARKRSVPVTKDKLYRLLAPLAGMANVDDLIREPPA